MFYHWVCASDVLTLHSSHRAEHLTIWMKNIPPAAQKRNLNQFSIKVAENNTKFYFTLHYLTYKIIEYILVDKYNWKQKFVIWFTKYTRTYIILSYHLFFEFNKAALRKVRKNLLLCSRWNIFLSKMVRALQSIPFSETPMLLLIHERYKPGTGLQVILLHNVC